MENYLSDSLLLSYYYKTVEYILVCYLLYISGTFLFANDLKLYASQVE